MKRRLVRLLVVLGVPSVLLLAGACAADGAPDHLVLDDDDAQSILPDSGALGADADAQPDPCSADGWCSFENPAPKANLVALWGSAANDLWAVGSFETILHWDGMSWKTVRTGGPRTYFGVWGTGDAVWVVHSTDVSYRLRRDGSDFEVEGFDASVSAAPTGRPLSAVWGNAPDALYAVGIGQAYTCNPGCDYHDTGGIFVSTGFADGGIGWASAGDVLNPAAGTGGLLAIHGVGEKAWTVGNNGMIASLERADGGVTMTQENSGTRSRLFAVWTDGDDVWAFGAAGIALHRELVKGMTMWVEKETGTKADLRGVWGTSRTNLWIVGANGTVLHFDGAEFRPGAAPLLNGKTADYHAVWGTGEDDIWAVGEGVIAHYGARPAGAP